MRRPEAEAQGKASAQAAGEGAAPAADEPHTLRMAELSARSGVARETIHFYLREGLLPRPRKGGRTVAYYGEEHLVRLRIIRRLREEKYLPLAVIRRLLDSPAAAAERDVDVLAEVLHILPTRDGAPVHSPAALREAEARGLFGAPRHGPPGGDLAEQRVLAAVEATLALPEAARELTFADLSVCAAGLSELVSREAAVFFEAVFQSGDLGASISALRSGRGAVARFVTAYRDLMLRRIVEDLLVAIEEGPRAVTRAATLPLSAAREAELGVPARRAALREAAKRGEPGAAAQLVWHLFGSGASAELAALSPAVIDQAGARLLPLITWGAHDTQRSAATLQAFERAVVAAPDLALGPILLAEATIARGVRRRGDPQQSLLDEVVPALHRLVTVDPGRDPERAAQAFAHFHRGRIELSLPPVLGRRARGIAALEAALALVEQGDAELDPAARARIAGNARLTLGRAAAAEGELPRAEALFQAAIAVDPAGPLGEAARAELG
jgi:DNA-binding transcriptional MerR regulator/tetratricopeptide (TPR) repeat protein